MKLNGTRCQILFNSWDIQQSVKALETSYSNCITDDSSLRPPSHPPTRSLPITLEDPMREGTHAAITQKTWYPGIDISILLVSKNVKRALRDQNSGAPRFKHVDTFCHLNILDIIINGLHHQCHYHEYHSIKSSGLGQIRKLRLLVPLHHLLPPRPFNL
jgi:hypothetical protein